MPHLPSPSSSASLSPPAGIGHRMVRQHSCSEDDSDQAARSALEIRREKNRIKQRNLRLRRATQMADLETTVQRMRSASHDLEDRLHQLEAREASLIAWVRDLEGALVQNGQREQVESLRRMWTPSVPMGEPMSGPQSASTRDPLATLATAAASSYRPSVSQQQRWEEDAANARKRRRQDDEYSASVQQHSGSRDARDSNSPSRAMRIDSICLPAPRPSSHSPSSIMSSEPWGWGHMSSMDHPSHSSHSFHQYDSAAPKSRAGPQDVYEQKPRVSAPAQDSHRSLSPADRRPLSSSSSGSTPPRGWDSPVASFAIRL